MISKVLFVIKAFDETKHPRHAKGSQGGGEFAPKDGTDTPSQKPTTKKKTNDWRDNFNAINFHIGSIASAIQNNESSDEDFAYSGYGKIYQVDEDDVPKEEDFTSDDGEVDEDALAEARDEWAIKGKEALYKKMGAAIKTILDDSDGVGVRRDVGSLARLLKQGHIGNVYTLPTPNDPQGLSEEEIDSLSDSIQTYGDTDYRDALEKAYFGMAAGQSDKERPVYGYVKSKISDNHVVDQYGAVEYILKPDVVKKRAFITVGDSGAQNRDENGEFKPKVAPSAFADPQGYSLSIDGRINPYDRYDETQSIFDIDDVSQLPTYMEAQIVGGVRLKDIARIEIHGDKDIDPAIEAKFNKLGILLEHV